MWIYDGAPDQDEVRLKVASPDMDKGGNIVIFFLDNGYIRVVSTLHPARSVAGWKNAARRYGGSGVTRILVSPPHLKYHDIKRKVLKELGVDDEPIPEVMIHKITEVTTIFLNKARCAAHFK